MERFSTVGIANEPTTLMAKTNMERTNVSVGALDTVQGRSDAALSIAADWEVDDNESISLVLPMKEPQRDRRGGARVKREPQVVKRKRSSGTDGVVHPDKRLKDV